MPMWIKKTKETNPLSPGKRVRFIQPKTFHLFHGEIQKIPKDHQNPQLAVVKAKHKKNSLSHIWPQVMDVEISRLHLLTN